MRNPVCLKCRQVIPGDDVNVAADVAYCRACNLVHALRTLAVGSDLEALAGSSPPGTWCRRGETETVIGARHYSPVIMGVTLFFGLCWGTMIFPATRALQHTLAYNAGLRVDDGHPASSVIGYTSMAENVVSVLAFVAFLLISAALFGAFFSCIAGRTEITVRATEAELFAGIGRFGRRLRFDPCRVTNVRMGRQTNGARALSQLLVVEFAGGEPLAFGTLLPASRRRYLAGVLHDTLISPK